MLKNKLINNYMNCLKNIAKLIIYAKKMNFILNNYKIQ